MEKPKHPDDLYTAYSDNDIDISLSDSGDSDDYYDNRVNNIKTDEQYENPKYDLTKSLKDTMPDLINGIKEDITWINSEISHIATVLCVTREAKAEHKLCALNCVEIQQLVFNYYRLSNTSTISTNKSYTTDNINPTQQYYSFVVNNIPVELTKDDMHEMLLKYYQHNVSGNNTSPIKKNIMQNIIHNIIFHLIENKQNDIHLSPQTQTIQQVIGRAYDTKKLNALVGKTAHMLALMSNYYKNYLAPQLKLKDNEQSLIQVILALVRYYTQMAEMGKQIIITLSQIVEKLSQCTIPKIHQVLNLLDSDIELLDTQSNLYSDLCEIYKLISRTKKTSDDSNQQSPTQTILNNISNAILESTQVVQCTSINLLIELIQPGISMARTLYQSQPMFNEENKNIYSGFIHAINAFQSECNTFIQMVNNQKQLS